MKGAGTNNVKSELESLNVSEEQVILEYTPYWNKCRCDRMFDLSHSHKKTKWTRIGGYFWRLEASAEPDGYIKLTLRCNFPVDDEDSFEVEATMLSGSQQKKTMTVKCTDSCIHFERLYHPRYDVIRVIVKLTQLAKYAFTATYSERCNDLKDMLNILHGQHRTDRFSDSTQTEAADVTFVIGDKELQSNSTKLAKLSPVFSAMLDGAYAEAETKRVIVEDATFDEFSSFLDALLKNGQISADNVESMHRLADKYDTGELTHRCRMFLWTADKMELLQKFVLAEAWDDDALLKKLTGEICDAAALTKLDQGGMTTALRPETISLILKKAISLV